MSDEKELKDQRIPIMMTASEVEAIDDWAFKHRIRSRGEAIRRLCQIGLIFDEHRAELNTKFKSSYEIASEITSLAPEVAAKKVDGTSNDIEVKLARHGIKTLMSLTSMVLLVRTLVGVANNYKGSKEVSEIMQDTKEMLSVPDTLSELELDDDD